MNVFIQTYGCQMNKLDSALITAALQQAGFGLTDSVKQADVVLLNTCSVREHAEQRVLSHLGHLKHIKQTRTELVVGVIGCMAQRLGAELFEHEVVDIVCGPAQIPLIVGLVEKTLTNKQKVISVTEKIREKKKDAQSRALDDFECDYDSDKRQLPGQAYVRVMRGCDNFCTYCVVPFVRGPEVSRPPGAITEQIKKLAGEGVKQVTFLGQRVNAYEYKAGDKTYCLADLLYLASDVDGIEWIRFVTSYPSQKFYDEILKAMAGLPMVCSYLHMPAQSGSDKILKKMNRHYTCAEYLELLEKAKEIVPGIALSGDFIVGFPNETEDDFQATLELVKRAKYKNCFIFKYSPRPGTIADKRLADTVPLNIKKERNYQLLSVQEKISGELSGDLLGREVKILVEGLSKKPNEGSGQNTNAPQLTGRTADDWIVVFNGPESLAGRFVKVKITKTSPFTLFGELTTNGAL